MTIQPKKSLGQHFLKDGNIIRKIVESFQPAADSQCIEIGPGSGAISPLLFEKCGNRIEFIEIDTAAVNYLRIVFPEIKDQIRHANFLDIDLTKYPTLSLIGNLPYNISSQILFKILENRTIVNYGVFMVQREVAERLAAQPGNKDYGILSVLLQTFYDVELLFRVSKNVFSPPPKVESAVFRIVRKKDFSISVPDSYFFRFVKTAFNKRRKMLRKSLEGFVNFAGTPESIHFFSDKRPEQLSKEDFLNLATFFYSQKDKEQ